MVDYSHGPIRSNFPIVYLVWNQGPIWLDQVLFLHCPISLDFWSNFFMVQCFHGSIGSSFFHGSIWSNYFVLHFGLWFPGSSSVQFSHGLIFPLSNSMIKSIQFGLGWTRPRPDRKWTNYQMAPSGSIGVLSVKLYSDGF